MINLKIFSMWKGDHEWVTKLLWTLLVKTKMPILKGCSDDQMCITDLQIIGSKFWSNLFTLISKSW